MLGKVETPILILAACYFSIIAIGVVFVLTFFVATSGILDFIHNQQKILITRHCKIYLEHGKNEAYNGCVRRALVYYEKEY